MPTLTSESGLSIEVADQFAEVPELETETVCLVAQVQPWDDPRFFRANLTVAVQPLAGDRATIQQLSALTIAGQIALGRHVVGCEVAPGPGGTEPGPHSARLITSVDTALQETIVQMQWVGICGDRAVTIGAQVPAADYGAAEHGIELAVRSLRWTFDDAPVTPAPDTMPHLDPAGREDLSGIRERQPGAITGPLLDGDSLDVLRRGKVKRRFDAEALQRAGFVDADRGLTESGLAAHRALASPLREITCEVRHDGAGDPARLGAFIGQSSAVVIADPPAAQLSAGQPPSGRAVAVRAPRAVADTLVRWLAIAPAWPLVLGEESDRRVVDAATFDARRVDPAAPAPADANPALARMWAEPWDVTRLLTTEQNAPQIGLVQTAGAGSVRIRVAEQEVGLLPMSPTTLLMLLLRLCGFQL